MKLGRLLVVGSQPTRFIVVNNSQQYRQPLTTFNKNMNMKHNQLLHKSADSRRLTTASADSRRLTTAPTSYANKIMA
nr:hypothetical protein [Tanacetum cinerariifolium]